MYARLLADPEVWAKPPRSVYEASAMAIERGYEEEPVEVPAPVVEALAAAAVEPPAAAAEAPAAAAEAPAAAAAAPPPRKSRRLKRRRCDTCGQAPCACEEDGALFSGRVAGCRR